MSSWVKLTCGNSSPSAHPPFDKALGQPPENWFWPLRTLANLMPFYLKVMLGTETSGDSSEQALDVVKACEGDARCHWPFHKVHGQTLVKTPHQPLLSAIFSVAVDIWEIFWPTNHRTNDKPGQSFNSLFYSSSSKKSAGDLKAKVEDSLQIRGNCTVVTTATHHPNSVETNGENSGVVHYHYHYHCRGLSTLLQLISEACATLSHNLLSHFKLHFNYNWQ